uniref:Uncharacterized protein n=1 Tax=Arundo donax TaxID=35708 RepID=A0A0A8YTM2_ARUDO
MDLLVLPNKPTYQMSTILTLTRLKYKPKSTQMTERSLLYPSIHQSYSRKGTQVLFLNNIISSINRQELSAAR